MMEILKTQHFDICQE